MNFTESQPINFREQFRFLDHAPVGATVMKDGVILYVNPKLLEIFHYDQYEELDKKPVDTLIPSSLREKLRKRGTKRQEGVKQPTSYKSVSLRKDGSHFTSQIDIDVIYFNDEVYLLGFVSDLTAEIESDDQLSLQETRFHDLLLLSPIPACFVLDRKVVSANHHYIELFGYESIDELQDKDTIQLFAPSEREYVEEIVAKREAGSYNPNEYEGTIVTKEGNKVKIKVHAKRTEWRDGVGILAYLEPIE